MYIHAIKCGCYLTFCGEARSVEMVETDEANEGAGLGTESGDSGGVARQLGPAVGYNKDTKYIYLWA